MNTYKYKFTVQCPNNDASVDYFLTIVFDTIIMVEDIIKACEIDRAYHEQIADILREELPGKHTIRAIHSSVLIITER